MWTQSCIALDERQRRSLLPFSKVMSQNGRYHQIFRVVRTRGKRKQQFIVYLQTAPACNVSHIWLFNKLWFHEAKENVGKFDEVSSNLFLSFMALNVRASSNDFVKAKSRASEKRNSFFFVFFFFFLEEEPARAQTFLAGRSYPFLENEGKSHT